MNDTIKRLQEKIGLLWDNLEMNLEAKPRASDNSPETMRLSNGVRIGLDRKSRYHLLLALRDGEEKIRSRLTAGISIKTTTFQIEDEAALWIDIIAERRWRFAIEPFAAELISKMVGDTIDLETLRTTVEEHRSLWAAPKEPLTISEQKGLIGELAIVMKLGRVIPPATAVNKWRGPDRGLHDISSETWAIEVKAFAEEPPRVRINHVEQLDHRIDKRLTIAGIHLYSDEEGKNLPDYVDEALEWADEHGVVNQLLEQLVLAKWREDERNEYFSRFTEGRIVLCPIRPETPVFPAELLEHIPYSVDKITYRLALNDLFQLDSNNEDNWKLLSSKGTWSDEKLVNFIDSEHSSSEDKYNLLIMTEQLYRQLAFENYVSVHGQKWWNNVPGQVRNSITSKLEEWQKKGITGIEKPTRKYWDAMTLGMLREAIITKQMWSSFEDLIGVSLGTFETNWKIFADLRNTTFHANDPQTHDHLQQGVSTAKILIAYTKEAFEKLKRE
jgi:hypothetical protein